MRIGGVIAVLVLMGSFLACGSPPRSTDSKVLMDHLEHADPADRAWAVSQICQTRYAPGLGAVVERLRDEDGGIRLMAVAGLRDWTGEEFGYRPFAPEEEREAAIHRWESWLATESWLVTLDGAKP